MDIRIIQGWCVEFFVLNNGKWFFSKETSFLEDYIKGKHV